MADTGEEAVLAVAIISATSATTLPARPARYCFIVSCNDAVLASPWGLFKKQTSPLAPVKASCRSLAVQDIALYENGLQEMCTPSLYSNASASTSTLDEVLLGQCALR